MFKSAKDNLIFVFILWIISISVIYYTMGFEQPLWFNIVFPIVIGWPVIDGLIKVIKEKDED